MGIVRRIGTSQFRYLIPLSMLVASVLVLTVSPPAASAQLTSGAVLGTVTDATGAVLGGVKVTIQNNATGDERQTLTNDIGVYRFSALEPGAYRVEFSIPGFQTRKIEALNVSAAQEIVINQALPVGNVESQIDVVAPSGAEIAKTSSTISRTLGERVVSDLATTSSRDPTRMALLAPLVSRAPGSNEFSANGQRPRNINFTLDGADNNDLSVSVPSARVIPEGIAEFQVQTAPYAAELGRNSGGQISIITRSGSNEFHGEAWNYYRGNWLEPLALANKRAGLKATPRFVHNQGGGSLGGPLVRDRAFFFGLFEVNRRREAPDARNAIPTDIPTPAGYEALLNLPLGAGQSAQSRQAMLKALSFLPEIHHQVSSYNRVRNISVNGASVEIANITIPVSRPADYWYGVGRVDSRISERNRVSYRYQLDHRRELNVASNLRFGERWAGHQEVFGQNHALSYTRVVSPRFLNEFRAAYIRRFLDFPENDPQSSTVVIAGFTTMGGLSIFPQGRISNVYQFQNTATYAAGKHTVKAGFDVRFNRLFNRSVSHLKGTWTFNSLQDFMNNQAARLEQSVIEPSFDASQTSQYYFIQDDYKATRNFTLNFGMRYEYSNVPLGFFGAANDTIAAAGVPRPTRPDRDNWAPRLGFQYSPAAAGGILGKLFGDGDSSIRGGFGMAYDVVFYNLLSFPANNYPRNVSSVVTSPQTTDLFPTLAAKITTIPAFNPLQPFVNVPEEVEYPTTNFWSLSIQRQFKTNYILEVGYSGSRSYHQIRQGESNPPVLTAEQAAAVVAARSTSVIPSVQERRLNPAWGARMTLEPAARAEYHAGYIKFDKKMSRGLLIGANYTFSGNFSDNDEALATANLADSSPQVPQDYFDYRAEWSRSVFDRPHRFAVHYIYELPWFAEGFAASPVMRQVFSGWQISGFTEFESGQPFTIRTGVDTAGINNESAGRPNYNPGGVVIPDPVTGDFRTFTIPLDGTGIVTVPLGSNGQPLANSMSGGGNLGRNTFRGPGFNHWNLSLEKAFQLTERVKFQVRSDFINIWNHNNFRNPEARMNSTSFGQNVSLVTDSRSILLSGRVRF